MSDDVISNSDDVTCADDDVITGPKLTRTHFTSSQSDIENCGANFEETDYYRTSSRVSISLFFKFIFLSSLAGKLRVHQRNKGLYKTATELI